MKEQTFGNNDSSGAVVVGQCMRRPSRKNSAVAHELEVTIDGDIVTFECLLQIPGATIRIQFELTAQRVLIDCRRATMVRLIFKAYAAVVEVLEQILNSVIDHSVFAKYSANLFSCLPRPCLELVLVEDNGPNLMLTYYDEKIILHELSCPYISLKESFEDTLQHT